MDLVSQQPSSKEPTASHCVSWLLNWVCLNAWWENFLPHFSYKKEGNPGNRHLVKIQALVQNRFQAYSGMSRYLGSDLFCTELEVSKKSFLQLLPFQWRLWVPCHAGSPGSLLCTDHLQTVYLYTLTQLAETLLFILGQHWQCGAFAFGLITMAHMFRTCLHMN